MPSEFVVFPAIDLRNGQVVRLKQGDPQRQTVYSADPAAMARTWLEKGARWLHVVNLDGAFGEADSANATALRSIIVQAQRYAALVQFGGGLRSLEALEEAVALGVGRVVLGTAALENPTLVSAALQRWGSEKVAVGLDACDGMLRTRGWAQQTQRTAQQVALEYAHLGLRWLVFTDIARDGLQTGINLQATQQLAETSGLCVVASGGVSCLEDVMEVHRAGLAGVIVGRALYEGSLDLADCFSAISKETGAV